MDAAGLRKVMLLPCYCTYIRCVLTRWGYVCLSSLVAFEAVQIFQWKFCASVTFDTRFHFQNDRKTWNLAPFCRVTLCGRHMCVNPLDLYLDTQNKMKPGVCKNVLHRRRLLHIFYRSLVLIFRTKCASKLWCQDVPVGITRNVLCWTTRSECHVLVLLLSVNSRGCRSTPNIWLMGILLFTWTVDISVQICVSSRSWSFWSKHVAVWTTVNVCWMLVVLYWIHLTLRYRTCPKL